MRIVGHRIRLQRRPGGSDVEPLEEPPPSHELIAFLCELGAALCRSQEATDRIIDDLTVVAAQYGVRDSRFFVLPTGVFVGVGNDRNDVTNFAPADGPALRLDQIDRLYALLKTARDTHVPPAEGREQLAAIIASPPRFSPIVIVAGQVLQTLGLGLIRNPLPRALVGYLVLGTIVGILFILARRFEVLSVALPVVAAFLVTVVAYAGSAFLSNSQPSQLLVPSLVVFLPGAALTIGAIDLATGSMVAGSARVVSAFYVLLLLAFGILIGVQVTGGVSHGKPGAALGWWAPVVGVLILGVGMFVGSSGPARSLPWLILSLYVVWAVQYLGTRIGNPAIGAFLGGLAITPTAYLVQRQKGGPPSQVTFLPAFWLLVPGAIGLTGVSNLLVHVNSQEAINTLLTTIVTVVAIALGVLVGSSLTNSLSGLRLSRVTPPEPQ